MTLKFNLTYWQVPRSSVGRASERTMLRSVVRVQSLARGNLSFLSSFFFLSFFYFFIFIFLIIFFSFLITRLWRLFLLIHISFIIKSITLFCSKCQIEVVHQNKNYQCTEIGKVILNWNRKSKWTEFPLTNWINSKPLCCGPWSGFNPWRGELVIFVFLFFIFFFLHFSHHILLLAVTSLWCQ